MIESAVSPDALRAAARGFPSGVTIAAASDGTVIHAITATAFCSLSLVPPLVLLSVSRNGQLLGLVRRAGSFAVSVLGEHQRALGEWASQSGRVPAATLPAWKTVVARTGAPIIPGAAAWFDCVLESMADHGDHTVLIGRVVEAGRDPSVRPLLYFDGSYHGLGERLQRQHRQEDNRGLQDA
jgi:flavin reductase (DIM6/NTAB) family NADH-FMN oxidoreductase RutF